MIQKIRICFGIVVSALLLAFIGYKFIFSNMSFGEALGFYGFPVALIISLYIEPKGAKRDEK